MFTKVQLRAQCADLGLAPGDLLMLHVSLRALGPVADGADTLIAALGETVAPDGALLGRGSYTASEEDVLHAHCPPFDPQRARARRSFDAFAEVFRVAPARSAATTPAPASPLSATGRPS